MERPNYSTPPSHNNFQEDDHTNLAGNIWTILSIFFVVILVAGIGDQVSKVEAEITIVVGGVIFGVIGAIIKCFSR